MDEPNNSKRRKFPWLFFVVVIVALGAVIGYSQYTPGNNIAWAKDVQAARQQSAETNKPVLMEFSASWCPACNAVKRNVWPDNRVEQFVNSRSVPLAVDVDQQQQLSAAYRINPIPAFIMTDSTGRELVRAEGYLDADGVIALVESAEREMARNAKGDAAATSTPPASPLPPAH